MNFSDFFIKRPIFAGVLSIIIFLVGALALFRLPVSEYPEVVPPTVVVRANYPGANPQTIADTVAAPLEQAINGVENSLYMFSQATSDGALALTVTFAIGTDLDTAQVQVQNRVAQVLPKLPQEVQRLGVTTAKTSPDLLMVVHLTSPEGRYDDIYVRNYATLQVRDVLARINGVGEVRIFGSGDYAMRVWLDPDKMANASLVPADVVAAIREQNVQVAAGAIAQQPVSNPADTQLLINTQGRLLNEEEFEDIIVKTGESGQLVRLGDVARLELGASQYSLRSLLNNNAAVALPISQLPGSNAIEVSNSVRETMKELKTNFPDGLDYEIVYDPTIFVRSSIAAVVQTLLEATVLVVLVVILFLQNWRASIIPLAAVPVSLVGTFAVLLALGFSINALSLFGLVLAIGIVVDDAIVVVENVERNLSLGHSPMKATQIAMKEVTGPIIATSLVLAAVFIPTAFITGLSGQFFKQFAITIAVSTFISTINSLTLSPALSALLLKPKGEKRDSLTKVIDFSFGWLFRPFNRFFEWLSVKYSNGVRKLIRFSLATAVLYAGLLAFTGWRFVETPTGFVPTQDKGYLVAFAQLPDAASLDRTDKVIRQMGEIALAHPGVSNAVSFPGLSINGFTNSPNSGIVFVTLDDFDQRTTPELSGFAIANSLQQKFGGIQDAFIAIFPPPPVQGLGTTAGFKLYVEDRGNLGLDALYAATQKLIQEGYASGELTGLYTSFTVNTPQLQADVDRTKAKQQGISLNTLYDTMQTYLGSQYVNDFNRFGRTYQVIAQADSEFRDNPDDIERLKTRNANGEMVPLGAVLDIKETYGPDRVMRYNNYPAAEINGAPAPGFSTGQAQAAIARLAEEHLPNGMAFEWTELTYQQILAGNASLFVFPISILLVFLVLAAQYESFRLPIAVLLIVPMGLLGALTGLYFTDGDNNIFTQIALIVLIGLAAKNAILIVEFAAQRRAEGASPLEAAVEAARLRLRPILMTSIAFIAGVYPLVASTGAGAEMRQAIGVAVFAGMIGVTIFGLFLTPVFYYILEKLGMKPTEETAPESPQNPEVLPANLEITN